MRGARLNSEQPTPKLLSAPGASVYMVTVTVQQGGQFTLSLYRDAAGQQLLKSYANPTTGATQTLELLLNQGLYYTLVGQPGPDNAYQVNVDLVEQPSGVAGVVDTAERP